MKLRQWQDECINLASTQYKKGNSHFLALATPGAGKTIMAANIFTKNIKVSNIPMST